jgi:hypothetical protein
MDRRGSGRVDITESEIGWQPNIPVDPDLLQPDHMAEALSHLGTVIPHKEEPPVLAPPPDPKPPPGRKAYQGARLAGPGHAKAGGAPLPLSPRPPGLPEFVLPFRRLVGRHHGKPRKTWTFRYPGDAAITARDYCISSGVADPQIGRDYIVWAEDGLVGWAPAHLVLNPPVSPVITPEAPMTLVSPIVPATPPGRPTREKLLAIHEKLNVVYDTAGAGHYTGSWSDQKVADELNVPPAWVAEERSRVFGDGVGNESDSLALDKWRRDLTNEAAKLGEDMLALAARVETLKTKISNGPKGTTP